MQDLMSNIILGLNSTQLEAVKHTEGPLLILAGAGTGKTKALTSRIAYILDQGLASPHEILAVTFTNKAAKEMIERVKQYSNTEGIWFGTFHSISNKILRIHGHHAGLKPDFNIIDTDDQLKIIKSIIEMKNLDQKIFIPKVILNIIQSWKDKALNPSDIQLSSYSKPIEIKAKEIYTEYQTKLSTSNLLDFGDLILYSINLFKYFPEVLDYYQRKFKFIHVDEYQDTNISQYIFIKFLADKHKNICVVGDDDQSIYGWRGAEIDNIINFKNYFPNAKIVKLEQNYRSTQNILTAASVIISNNSNRLGKSLWTNGNIGEKIYVANLYNDIEEADFFAKVIKHLTYNGYTYNQIAILVRAGFQTRAFEESFFKNSINYKVLGGLKFYERLEIKDALAYIRLINNPHDDLAFERALNTPKRGVGASTIKQLQNFALLSKSSLFSACEEMIKQDILPSRAAKPLSEFIYNVKSWKLLLDSADNKHYEVIETVLKESGYIDMWLKENKTEAETRIQNLKELYRALQDFTTIQEFLEHVSLVSTADEELQGNYISIMTLHAAKGLEFDTVILPGWEEGIFPSIREGDSNEDIEEERRLAYVGITRARKKLFISFVRRRKIYNSFHDSEPSRFLLELPKNICQSLNYNSLYRAEIFLNNKNENSINEKIEDGKNTATGLMNLGDRVFHNKFGYGRVVNVNNDNIQVIFDHSGIKIVKMEFLSKKT